MSCMDVSIGDVYRKGIPAELPRVKFATLATFPKAVPSKCKEVVARKAHIVLLTSHRAFPGCTRESQVGLVKKIILPLRCRCNEPCPHRVEAEASVERVELYINILFVFFQLAIIALTLRRDTAACTRQQNSDRCCDQRHR